MEPVADAHRKDIQANAAQVMAGLIDVATALGLNSETCAIHLSEPTPDISTVRQLIDRLLRDAEDIACLTRKLQRLMLLEVEVCGRREISSSTGLPAPLSSFYDHRSLDTGDLHRDTN